MRFQRWMSKRCCMYMSLLTASHVLCFTVNCKCYSHIYLIKPPDWHSFYHCDLIWCITLNLETELRDNTVNVSEYRVIIQIRHHEAVHACMNALVPSVLLYATIKCDQRFKVYFLACLLFSLWGFSSTCCT